MITGGGRPQQVSTGNAPKPFWLNHFTNRIGPVGVFGSQTSCSNRLVAVSSGDVAPAFQIDLVVPQLSASHSGWPSAPGIAPLTWPSGVKGWYVGVIFSGGSSTAVPTSIHWLDPWDSL